MTTCMLLHKSLDQVFWAEVMNCENYIQNRSPHKALDGVTPFEAWNGRKPTIKHFRVFGCPAWAQIPPQKCKALEPQSKPCIFFGYVDSHKAYKLMDPETHEIFYDRSVHFEESCPIFTSSTPPSSFIEESDNDDSDLEDVFPQSK